LELKSLEERLHSISETFCGCRFWLDGPSTIRSEVRIDEELSKTLLALMYLNWSLAPKLVTVRPGSIVVVGRSWVLFFNLSRDGTWQAGNHIKGCIQ